MKNVLSMTIVFAILAWVVSLNMAHAQQQTVIVNNYQPSGHFCWGLVGCLVAHALDEQERQPQGPHACNVWNGRRYVQGTCAP